MTFMHVTETASVAENRSWLPSPHGSEVNANPNITLLLSLFNQASHYPNGYLPSGLPVRVDDLDDIRPWADATGARLGFLKGDFKTDGVEDVNVSVITRGNIKVAKLPIAFTPPTTAVQPRFFFGS